MCLWLPNVPACRGFGRFRDSEGDWLVVLSGDWLAPRGHCLLTALPSLKVRRSPSSVGPRLDAPHSLWEMLFWVWTLPTACRVLCPVSKGSTGFHAACVYRGHCRTPGILKALDFPFCQLIASSGQPVAGGRGLKGAHTCVWSGEES